MQMQRSASVVRVGAPAKVNLFLEVLARRSDGYHELATLMLAVSLYDTLEFTEEPPGATALHCDHPSLSTGPDNLICRAVDLVRRQSGRSDGVGIRLWKRIPMAAGLAGGSSDAAATLAGLNRLWRLGWDRGQLARLGAELGSDVSFFFAAPAAWCTGRGERIEPLRLGRPLDLVLVAPSGRPVHGGGVSRRHGADRAAIRRGRSPGRDGGRRDRTWPAAAQSVAAGGRAAVSGRGWAVCPTVQPGACGTADDRKRQHRVRPLSPPWRGPVARTRPELSTG